MYSLTRSRPTSRCSRRLATLGAAEARAVGRLDRHRRTRRMKRALIVFLLVNLMLSTCAPVSAPTSTPAPSATPLPTATAVPTSTATPTSTPTATPTATPTPIPTIQVGNLSVPDPRATNPELFDVTKKGSPIVEYANAFKLNSADVLAGLHPEVEKPKGMPEFITMRTSDEVALMMATQNENGEWVWQRQLLPNIGELMENMLVMV
jgi:ABC-type transport system substrate-binding protein